MLIYIMKRILNLKLLKMKKKTIFNLHGNYINYN